MNSRDEIFKKRQEYAHLCSRQGASENNRFQKVPQKTNNNRNRSKITAPLTASNIESANHAASYLSHGLGGSSNHLSTCHADVNIKV